MKEVELEEKDLEMSVLETVRGGLDTLEKGWRVQEDAETCQRSKWHGKVIILPVLISDNYSTG